VLTYAFALIGYPIKHSLSPWIHEQFLQQTNQDGTYSIIEINPHNDFATKVAKLKNSNLDGFNITVPYKEKVIPYLDEIDEQAKEINAVNTVLNQDGKWIGYNTDGIGYMRALTEQYPAILANKNINILLLGAGGAAKGIMHALLSYGYRNITIANRSLARAKQLQQADEHINVLSLAEVEDNLSRYHLIIQTTSVGMKPNSGEAIISLQSISRDVIASDIVYQPLYTTFLKEANDHGANIHLGHTMLLYQAQYAFEIWTGHRPDVSPLNEPLKRILEG